MGWIKIGLVFLCSGVHAQGYAVRGLSVYGQDREDGFPVIVRDSAGYADQRSQYITIQFDVLGAEPPPLKIRFLHCNRNWEPDQNLFVQDESHNTSFVLDYRSSPDGVVHYSYRYTNRFPDTEDIVRFNYSGNWLFQVMDKEESTILGEGRFFVVDEASPTTVKVMNSDFTDATPPLNQVHNVQVGVQLRDELEGYFHTTVDIYQNRRLFNPYRVDVNDADPHTKVDGFNRGYRVFTARNILPGNEYRTLDISNLTRYPNRLPVRIVEGVDQPRPYWNTGKDRGGTASLNGMTGSASEYLNVRFRLDVSSLHNALGTHDDVFVVGPFNQWRPLHEDRLEYDNGERSHVVNKLLRRGIYDFQYITGSWDETLRTVVRQDWVVLEGNDWRTTNTYHAMVYYNDARFGGFDRIVGFGVGRSPGTASSH